MTVDRRTKAEQQLRARASVCTRCPQLVASRSQVVFASGGVGADLMFVGEAPGASEDREGIPFVGASGRLLDQLLAGIGISREDVYIANVLKCRPPENRDPRRDEIANCSEYLERQVELVQPVVVVTLGNFATKLLRGDEAGITTLHGQAEELMIGSRAVRLYPVFHPASALYRRPNLELLREDFARLPALIALGAPDQPVAAEREPEKSKPSAVKPETAETKPLAAQRAPTKVESDQDDAPQLDLF